MNNNDQEMVSPASQQKDLNNQRLNNNTRNSLDNGRDKNNPRSSEDPNDAAYAAIRSNPETTIRPIEQQQQEQQQQQQQQQLQQQDQGGLDENRSSSSPRIDENFFKINNAPFLENSTAAGYSDFLNRYRLEQIRHLTSISDPRLADSSLPTGGGANNGQQDQQV